MQSAVANLSRLHAVIQLSTHHLLLTVFSIRVSVRTLPLCQKLQLLHSTSPHGGPETKASETVARTHYASTQMPAVSSRKGYIRRSYQKTIITPVTSHGPACPCRSTLLESPMCCCQGPKSLLESPLETDWRRASASALRLFPSLSSSRLLEILRYSVLCI